MISHRSGLAGFTLIELMISLAIGSIVTSAGLSLYLQISSSRSLLQAELALQENNYYVNQTMKQLLYQAGYRPLDSALLPTPLLPIKSADQSFAGINESWDEGEFIRVEDNGIAIRFEGSSDSSGDADGTIIDCQGRPIAGGEISDVKLSVESGALLCTTDGDSVELLSPDDGVTIDSIAVLWGVDSNNDNDVDEYVTATNNLQSNEKIMALRVLLLLSSRDNVKSGTSSYRFNGVRYSSDDSRLRKESVTTVQIRN
ncbi:MAG: PilW family protein [Granulosicoccus sp.]